MKNKRMLISLIVIIFALIGIPLFNFVISGMSARNAYESTEPHNNDSFSVLILGFDTVANNTDVMMVVSYDFKSETMSVMQIPRDTYVNTDGGKGRKINSLFSMYKTRGQKDAEALGSLKNFVSENMSIEINGYAAMTTQDFVEIVNSIGGVKINVPYDLKYNDDSQDLHIDIKAGEHILSGEEALGFVRYRQSYIEGDLGRMDAQKIFLNALSKQLFCDTSKTTLMKTATKFASKIKTDIKASNLINMFRDGIGKNTEIRSFTIPGESARRDGNSGEWFYIINKNSANIIINQTLNQGRYIEFDKKGIFSDNSNIAFSNIYNDKSFNAKIYYGDDTPNILIRGENK